MSNTINQPISMTPEEKAMAQEDSKKLFGIVNLSGYVRYLIRQKNKKQ